MMLNDRAQMEVLGNVLLVGLVVLLVSIVGVAVLSPLVQQSNGPVVDTGVDVSPSEVRLTHMGGDRVRADALRVYLRPGAPDGMNFTADYNRTYFDATDVWTTAVNYETGQQVRVMLVHVPSGSVLADEHVHVDRTDDMP